MRSRALAVCLALLCVLAGCNGLQPGATTDPRGPPSVTPAEVPHDMAGGTLAPGLTDEGVVDAEALHSAHRRALANRSVTVGARYDRRFGDGATYETAATYRFGPNRTTSSVDVSLDGDPSSPYDRESRWTNGSVTYSRAVVDGSVVYDRRPVTGPSDGRSYVEYRTEALGGTLAGLRVESVEYVGTVAGQRAYRVHGTLPEGSYRCTEGGDEVPAAADVGLLVDERGLVRSVEQRVTRCRFGPDGNTEETIVSEVRFGALGETDPAAPEWVADARERIADREYVAPGVTTERVVDPAALHRAHERVAGNLSVTMEYERRRTAPNGTLLERTERTARVGTEGRALSRRVSVDADGRVRTQAQWTNGSVGFVRERLGDAVQYYRHDEVIVRATRTPGLPELVRFADETTVTALGDGRYRVTARGIPTRSYGPEPVDLPERAGSVSFVVDERGFVSRGESSLVVSDRGRAVRVTRSVAYTAVGGTTVERPDWLPAAANATGGV
jgi:hypothetical protein